MMLTWQKLTNQLSSSNTPLKLEGVQRTHPTCQVNDDVVSQEEVW